MKKYYIDEKFRYAIFDMSKISKEEIKEIPHGEAFIKWINQEINKIINQEMDKIFTIDKNLYRIFKKLNSFYQVNLSVDKDSLNLEIDIRFRMMDNYSKILLHEKSSMPLDYDYDISLIIDGFSNIGINHTDDDMNVYKSTDKNVPLIICYKSYIMFIAGREEF